MKRELLILTLVALLIAPMLSAEILVTQQPKDLYNLGEIVTIPTTILAAQNTNAFLIKELICGGKIVEVGREPIYLSAGEEERVTTKIPLETNFIEESVGSCKVKFSVGEEMAFTEDFKISGSIEITLVEFETSFDPGQEVTISGEALKENGQVVEGFIELNLTNENFGEPINAINTINEGSFSLTFLIPENAKAGEHSVKLRAYERGITGETTNYGTTIINLPINQIPKNLELFTETDEIEPGTIFQIKAILRDQSGEKIPTTAIITIKESNDKIITQFNEDTDVFLEHEIPYNQKPGGWKIHAVSQELESDYNVEILEKKEVETEIRNSTLIVKNRGNVYYDEVIMIKIGEQNIEVETNLEVDEEKEYELAAPDGTYKVTIGETSAEISLTGKVIEVKEKGFRFFTHPIVWIFIVLILAFIAFMIFRKGYKRSFFGKKHSSVVDPKDIPKEKVMTEIPKKSEESTIMETRNRATLSLSLKGQKQSATIIGLKIKNFSEVFKNKHIVKETLEDLSKLAESNKTQIYENSETIFFIFAPAITRTFKNEQTALAMAEAIKLKLNRSNKLFKQSIDYGISIHEGEIVAKPHEGGMDFMGMGTLIATSKKLSTLSENAIVLSEKIKNKVDKNTKVEKKMEGNLPYFVVTERKSTAPEHKKFINKFVERNFK